MRAGLDPRLDQNIDGAARHDQVLDIVAADQHESSPAINRGRLDESKAALPRPQKTRAGAAPAEKRLERPDGEGNQRAHEQ